MAKSRQQLINASSFLSDQKEKIGGLNVKRSTITADSFKKGSSQESVDNIEARVTANEKKITLLKKTIKLRKGNVDKQLKSVDTPQQMGSPLLESLQSIASTVDSIRDTLIQQQDNDKSVAESMRREKEEDERKGQEKGLESSKPNILQKVGDTVMKPVMGLFGKIFNFLKTLFLGKILMNFIDWFSNPANQGKIQTLVRFVKDWWPALTAAVLLFGTGFGGLVAGLIKTILFFIPAMTKAIVALKSAKFMSMIPGVGKIGKVLKVAAPLALAGGVGYGIGRMQGGDDQQEPLQMNKGGTVPGSGNKDTVPAMLTPGEFVMSKGAVEEYGVGTLEGMNAAAGGTNIPVMMPDKKRKGFPGGGRPYAPTSNAGVVTDPEERKQQEAYMLKFVNEERERFLGLPPLTNLTYAPGVELTKMRGPGPRTKETSDTFTDLDRGIETTSTSKTVDGKTTFGASMRQTTEEDRQKFFAENPHAAQLLNIKNQFELDELGDDISASAKMNSGGLVSNVFNSISNFNGGGLVQYLNNGGEVMSTSENATMRGGQVVSGNMSQSSADYTRKKLELVKAKNTARQIYGFNSPEVNQIKKQLLILDGTPAEAIVIPKGKGEIKVKGYSTYKGSGGTRKKKGGGFGLKRMIGGAADQLTGNLFDFDKRSGGGLVRKTAGAVGGLFGGNKKEGGTKGSSGILGPISSNVDGMVNRDKYEVKPKEKKNTVVAYQQAVNEQQQQNQEATSDGNEIPNFTIRPSFMIDEAKVDVLGIMV